jgi:DNA modification methylase
MNYIDQEPAAQSMGLIPNLLSNDLVVETVDLSHLKLPTRQTRKYKPEAVKTAIGITERFDEIMPMLVDNSYTIIHGLEFFEARKKLGLKTAKVIRLSSLSETDRRVLTLGLQRLPELSSFDDAALSAEMRELQALKLDLDLGHLTGFSVGELDHILYDDTSADAADEGDLIPHLPLTPTTRLGDVWRLGSHLIVCGSVLDASSIAHFDRKQKAAMLLTDPPYGIKIQGNVSRKHPDFKMGAGEQTPEEYTQFLRGFLINLIPILKDGALLFIFMDRRHLFELQTAAQAAGLTLFDLAIWNKITGGMGSFYRSQHEPCMIFKKGKAPHINNIELGKHGRYRTNVWDHPGRAGFGKGRTEDLAAHPTVKPVALLAEAIKDCTNPRDIIIDAFLGSGSTILAAERCNRVVYGVEIDPTYVDVAITRWQTFTGLKAVLEETGQTFLEVQSHRNHADHPFKQALTPDNVDPA